MARKKIDVEEARDLRAKLWSYDEIAERFGVTKSSVLRALRGRSTSKLRAINWGHRTFITVSAVHRETKEERTVCADGYGRSDTLRDAIAILERVPGPWQVRAISTPDTILQDVRGRKPNASYKKEWIVSLPEFLFLEKIGRLDLAPDVRYQAKREANQRAKKKRRSGVG